MTDKTAPEPATPVASGTPEPETQPARRTYQNTAGLRALLREAHRQGWRRVTVPWYRWASPGHAIRVEVVPGYRHNNHLSVTHLTVHRLTHDPTGWGYYPPTLTAHVRSVDHAAALLAADNVFADSDAEVSR